MYDQDNSGAISPEEMVEIFTLMYSVQVGVASLQGKSTDTILFSTMFHIQPSSNVPKSIS